MLSNSVRKIANELVKQAGVWALPNSPAKIQKLRDILIQLDLKDDNDALITIAGIEDKIYNLIGADDLFDDIASAKKPITDKAYGVKKEIRKAIIKRLKTLAIDFKKSPENFSQKVDVDEINNLIEKGK